MKIIGRELAVQVYQGIEKKIARLQLKKIVPHLVIVKSMDIDAVNNYINQKIKKGKKVGVEVEVVQFDDNNFKDMKKIKKTITHINNLASVHGIIFQKPSNPKIDDAVEKYIDTSKDVDGFLSHSAHKPPVYNGVMMVLGSILNASGKKLIAVLKKKRIVLIGKGKTGGGTVLCGLKNDEYDISKLDIIDSKTTEKQRKAYIENAQIIISAVGKENPVDFKLFAPEAIVIDIGVHFDSDNKIKGDFNEDDIKDRVNYYTTTPGGIGALTVAYLMDNTVNSAISTLTNSKKL